jgi:protein TonB
MIEADMMLLSLLAAASAPQGDPYGAARLAAPRSVPRPLNPGAMITNADYPAEALRANQQGTVTFRLTVDPQGRATDCVILASSGSNILDSATCRLLVRRSRFDPARSEDGKPIASTFTSRMSWRIPKPAVPTPGLMATILELSPRGEILSCRAETRGPVPEAARASGCAEAAGPSLKATLAGTAPGYRRITFIRAVSEGAQSFPFAPSEWGTLLSRRSVDVAYSAGGALLSCTARVTVGLGPDLCGQLGNPPTGAAEAPARRFTLDVALIGVPR